MSRFSFALLVLTTLWGNRTLGQVNEDFESGLTTSWSQSPANRWTASTDRPISGVYSLKHTFDNTIAESDYIGLTMNLSNITEGAVKWRFQVKHGYAPSAANRWSVFLMTSADANQMKNGNLYNGYSVGINTTGSDDKLRVYRHSIILDTQVTEVLLETSFNWETEVGTSKATAFEIERSASGVWTLKVAKDGLFANLVTLGTFENSDFGTMQNFVVAYSYTSSADRNLWLDNLSVTYTPSNINNRTSIVNTPSTQVADQHLQTTDTSETLSKELLRFRIADLGDGDGLPTKPTLLKFQRSTSAPDFSKTFGKLYLKSETSNIPIKSTLVTENCITLELDEGAVVVTDGSQEELSLWATIQNPITITDHTSIGVAIPATDHGWIAALSGSGFSSTFPSAIEVTHTVEVLATQLTLNQQPLSIQKNKPFTIAIDATDHCGNRDADYTTTATLSLQEGTGSLTIPQGSTLAMENGTVSWNNLTYSGSDRFTLKIISGNLGEIITQYISITNDSTSTIELAPLQPSVKELSPGCQTTACATAILNLIIHDIGGDGLPTTITQVKLANAATTSAADWTKVIRFFSIKANSREVSLGNPIVTKTAATIPILPGDLMISDGESAEISILVGLNDRVTDGEALQIKVESPIHGFTTAITGSAFVATLPQEITSNTFPINVVANRLIWKKIPTIAAVGEPWEVEVDAVDRLGNLDLNYSSVATLSLTDFKGRITTATTTAIAGKAPFTGVALNHSGEYRVVASAGSLSETPQSKILIADWNSSITASTNTIPSAFLPSNGNDFVPILSIDIHDWGTTDTLPTIITKAVISISQNDTSITFSPISGIELRTSTGIAIPISTTLISTEKVEVNFTEGIPVDNGSSRNVVFYATPTHYPVTDHTVFQFKIPVKDFGWEVGSNSTLLSQTQPYEILSPQFTTQVKAKMLQSQVKQIISTSETPNLVVQAADSLGNVDQDFTTTAEAKLFNLTTGETNIYSANFLKGEARFNSIGNLPAGKYWVTFATEGLQPNKTDFEVASNKTCLVNENFESGIIPETWVGKSDWKMDQSATLGGVKSIRHNGLPDGKTATLSIPVEANLRTDNYALSITIKNGAWTPSSDNNFLLLLSSNSINLASDTISGYAIGVDLTGDDDTLKVWQIVQGKVTKTLLSSDCVWGENSRATIDITLLSDGERILSLNGRTYPFTDTTLANLKCFGLKFNYTSTRAGQLWADDITLCKFASGPRLLSASRLGSGVAQLRFSEPIADATALETKINLWQTGNRIQPTSVVLENGSILFATLTDLSRKATLSWRNLLDSEGNSSSDSLAIDFGPSVEFGSVVFNEIMADPTPVVGLPECEYLELYSRSLDTLNLNGWTLNAGNSRATLQDVTLLPDHYLLLTTTTCASQPQLAENGAIGVTAFPSLTNAGAQLTLKDQAGSIVAMTSYSDEWYRDAVKKEGGYSLEKIDPENLSEDSLNWKASDDLSGGTPGRLNSVKTVNPDITAPTLEVISVIDEQTILLEFSEPLQITTITNERFTVDGNLGAITLQNVTNPISKIQLAFSNKMVTNTIYRLTIGGGITDLAGNNLTLVEIPFAITNLPQWQELVINELLFNPNAGGADFIEIYNRASVPFNLKNLKLYRRDDTGVLESEVKLSDHDRLILPNQYVAVAANPENIKQLYHCPIPENLLLLNIPAMNDDQGTVVLTDSLGARVDEVTYSDKMHYPLLASTEGVSLERVNPDMASDKASSWQSASQLSGFATPAAKNSCYRAFEEVGARVTIDPELFSPDGDGYHDVTYIRLKLAEPGWSATITIYDSKGREVRKLLNNALVDVDGEIAWNGLSNHNQLAEMGIYVVLVEMFHLNGEVRKEKKVVVVGGRL